MKDKRHEKEPKPKPTVTVDRGDRLMTAKEVATVFHASEETIRRWVRLRKLRAYRLPTGRIRFKRSEVNAKLAECGLDSI